MIKKIITDPLLLQRVSTKATSEDLAAGEDLLDTLRYHQEHCVGMAGNMIGVLKAIIAIQDMETKDYLLMLNPQIIKTGKEHYIAQEGCLSLSGVRKTLRYETIKVQYQNTQMKQRIKTFHGMTAQIIQHEIDHCRGILI